MISAYIQQDRKYWILRKVTFQTWLALFKMAKLSRNGKYPMHCDLSVPHIAMK